MKDIIIIDNSTLSFSFQPENGMPILSWYDDRTDTKLIELIPVLKLLSEVPDVRPILRSCCTKDNIYLTEKSILMCTKIIEDVKRRQQLTNNLNTHELQKQPSEQGKDAFSMTQQKPPKMNTWVLVPP